MNENGTLASRTPIVIVPLSRMRFSVSTAAGLSWPSAQWAVSAKATQSAVRNER
jgi:hypothetical protein